MQKIIYTKANLVHIQQGHGNGTFYFVTCR